MLYILIGTGLILTGIIWYIFHESNPEYEVWTDLDDSQLQDYQESLEGK